jgi:hypothetical protein
MSRMQIIESLKLGRNVEVEIRKSCIGARTFLEIWPVVGGCRGTLQIAEPGTERRLVRKVCNADVIREYRIRRCSLRPGWETNENDWDHFLLEEAWTTCITIADLETTLLEQFDIKLEELRLPGATDSPL